MKKIASFVCAIAILSGVFTLTLSLGNAQAQAHAASRGTVFQQVNINIDVMENHSYYVEVSVFAEVFVSIHFPFSEYTIFLSEIHGEHFAVTPTSVTGGNLRLGHNRDWNLRPYRTWFALQNSIHDISSKPQTYSVTYHVQFINYDDSDNHYFDWALITTGFSQTADIRNFRATINMPAPFNSDNVEVFYTTNHRSYYPANFEMRFFENTILLISNEPIPARHGISIRIPLPDGYFVNVPTSQSADTLRRVLYALILLPMFIAAIVAVLFRRKIITSPYTITNIHLILVAIGVIPLLLTYIIIQVFEQPWLLLFGFLASFLMIVGAVIMLFAIHYSNAGFMLGSVVFVVGIVRNLMLIIMDDFPPMIFFAVLSASISFMFAVYVRKFTRENLSEDQSDS